MIKQLTPLEELEILKEANTIYCGCASNLFARYRYEIETIETALKEKGKQDLILDFLKEHIVFEGGVVKANFQWVVEDKETEEAIKEWLK